MEHLKWWWSREGEVVLHVLMLLACAVVIYLSCEWFVNSVEWLGLQLNVGSMAVGSVLAAVGTALPESVVTLVAVTFGGGEHGAEIGVGAAMGGPLVVGTIAYAAVGVTLLATRRTARGDAPRADAMSGGRASALLERPNRIIGVNTGRLARDQTWFLSIFVVKVALGLIAFAIKPWLGLLFFAMYAVYFWRELRGDSEVSAAELAPLKLQPRRATPARWAVLVQTGVTLVLIFEASRLFVSQLEWAGPAMGMSPAVVAMLLAPVATELPEVMNALIWVRQGKTQLALANISGSMMIQATIPSGLGLLFTPWLFDTPLVLAGIATVAAISYLLVLLRLNRLTPIRLSFAAAFYVAFAVSLTLFA